jgi:hypothetical protein
MKATQKKKKYMLNHMKLPSNNKNHTKHKEPHKEA